MAAGVTPLAKVESDAGVTPLSVVAPGTAPGAGVTPLPFAVVPCDPPLSAFATGAAVSPCGRVSFVVVPPGRRGIKLGLGDYVSSRKNLGFIFASGEGRLVD